MDHEGQTTAFVKDKKIRHLNRIKSAIQNMVTTLNNFLSLDQLELGKVSTAPESFNIQKFSEEIIDKLSEKLKPGQKIDYVHSSAVSMVYMDKAILGNVLLNLLTNAIKYSPENSVVNYATHVNATGLEFTVEDHGIGIPEGEQANLFERFFRAKNTLNIEGTGLGLSIVKKYVDLLNGHISFISHENEGSIFKIFVINAVMPAPTPADTPSLFDNKKEAVNED
jgi:signal transduction histidine kinase